MQQRPVAYIDKYRQRKQGVVDEARFAIEERRRADQQAARRCIWDIQRIIGIASDKQMPILASAYAYALEQAYKLGIPAKPHPRTLERLQAAGVRLEWPARAAADAINERMGQEG